MRNLLPYVKPWLKPLPVSVVVIVTLLIIPLFADKRGIALACIILGSVIGLWMSIAAHELGHLVAGKWVDFRFVLFIAGPLVVLRTAKGIRISANEVWRLPGLSAMMPERTSSLQRRHLWMIAGGPVISLLIFGVIGGLLLVAISVADKKTLQEAAFAHPPFWRWAILACITAIVQMGAMSLLAGISSLWPASAKQTGLMSDGGRIRMLLRGGADADRWISSMMLMNTSMTGRRPREWDAQWIQPVAALSDKAVDEWQACLLAYLWALDRGDVDLAGAYLDHMEPLLEKVPLLRTLAAAEAAFFEARHRDNLERAREWFASASPQKDESRLRAETAIYLGEGRWAEAKQSGEAALVALAESSSSIEVGINTAKEEWIHSLLADAKRGAQERSV